MEMFKPDCYELLAFDYEWILANPVVWQNKAYKHWKRRLDSVDEWLMNRYPHGNYYNQALRIWEELYKRCSTIKYPDCVKFIKFEEQDLEKLANMPAGSFLMRSGGRNVGGFYNNEDPKRIGPEFDFNPPNL